MIKNRKLIFLVIGAILIAVSLVIVFTRPALSSFFDFSSTGPIGDTIGGITSPLFNLLGAILVFLSFREQYRANELQVNALNSSRAFENIEKMLNEINREIQNLEYSWTISKSNGKVIESRDFEFKGVKAITAFAGKILELNNGKILLDFTRDLLYVLDIIEYAVNKINNYPYDKNDKEFFLKRISNLWIIKLNPALIEVSKNIDLVTLIKNPKHNIIEAANAIQDKLIAVSALFDEDSEYPFKYQ